MQIIVGRFHNHTHALQLRERFQRPLLRSQFDGLAILGFALPPDACELAGLEIRMLLQNPQCIATGNGCVLAGVTRKDNAGVARQVKQPFHVVNADCSGFIQHHQPPVAQQRF